MTVALITGGQQGIGLGIAQALQAAGFRIAIAAEQQADADAVRDGLAALHDARYFRHDLAQVDAMATLRTVSRPRWGP